MIRRQLEYLRDRIAVSWNNREVHVLLCFLLIIVFLLEKIGFAFSGLFNLDNAEYHALIKEYFYLPSYGDLIFKRIWTFVTYMFMHASLMHLINNLFIIYFFGQLLEDLLGKKQLWQVFVLGGILGGVFFIAAFNLFPIFEEKLLIGRLVGASGGAFAILIALLTLSPNYKVNFFGIIPIKIKWIGMFFILNELLSISDRNSGGHFAHLGGALMGFVFIYALQGKIEFPKIKFKKKPKKTNFKVKINKSYNKKENISKSKDEIDAILSKIAQFGYDSLSEKEKEALFKQKQ